MWESLRAYICALLAGTIFMVCQALSGGTSGDRGDGIGIEPGDRSYRVETTGRGRRIPSGAADGTPLTPAPLHVETATGAQTD